MRTRGCTGGVVQKSRSLVCNAEGRARLVPIARLRRGSNQPVFNRNIPDVWVRSAFLFAHHSSSFIVGAVGTRPRRLPTAFVH